MKQYIYDSMKLVAAHDSSMELVESAALTGDRELPLYRKLSNKTAAANGSNSPSSSFVHRGAQSR